MDLHGVPRQWQVAGKGWQSARCFIYSFWAPDDGRRNRLKHIHFTEINNLCKVASCWLYLKIRLRCTDPWTSNLETPSICNVPPSRWQHEWPKHARGMCMCVCVYHTIINLRTFVGFDIISDCSMQVHASFKIKELVSRITALATYHLSKRCVTLCTYSTYLRHMWK